MADSIASAVVRQIAVESSALVLQTTSVVTFLRDIRLCLTIAVHPSVSDEVLFTETGHTQLVHYVRCLHGKLVWLPKDFGKQSLLSSIGQ